MNTSAHPLLLTADPDLQDTLLAAAGAVGIGVAAAIDPGACPAAWASAPLVLVGADLADAVARARLPTRVGVLLVVRAGLVDQPQKLARRIGAGEVVELPTDEAALLDRLADTAEPAAAARVIGVIGGRGGAGTSVIAAGLALTAAADGPAWLVDLDPLGGGADAGLGGELAPGARWAELVRLTGRPSTAALRAALPDVLGVAVVAVDPLSTEDPPPAAVRAVLSAARRGGGTVVLDLARHPSAGRSEALLAVDELFVVVPAEVRSVLAARQLLATLTDSPSSMAIIVRTGPRLLPVPEVARGLELPIAGELRDEPAVAAALLAGHPAGLLAGKDLAALCARLLEAPTAAKEAA